MGNRASKNWRELNGDNNWDGLLDPLDLRLRRLVIQYGEMAEATYDAFNREKASRFAGACRFSRSHFFENVGPSLCRSRISSKYTVTKFLYATSSIELPEAFMMKCLSREAWSKESNWMGYIAVTTEEGTRATGRREVVVVWRGTLQPLEWIDDFQSDLVSGADIFGEGEDADLDPRVHMGWHSIYTSDDPRSPFNKISVRDQALKEVRRLINKHGRREEMSITITGHSLGGALATLNAADIVSNNVNTLSNQPTKPIPVTAIVFASPRVGDLTFKNLFQTLPNLHLLRVCNAPDIVAHYPFLGYSTVGIELEIDTRESGFLKRPGTPMTWHDLEIYLHGVSGFGVEVERDVCLVNKWVDAAREEERVPVSWWVEKNKGMVQGDDGHWRLMDRWEDGDGSDGASDFSE